MNRRSRDQETSPLIRSHRDTDRRRYLPAGRASTSIASSREPFTAEFIGISHSPTAALRMGVKFPPFRSGYNFP